jgi:hypothetical protein
VLMRFSSSSSSSLEQVGLYALELVKIKLGRVCVSVRVFGSSSLRSLK